MLTCMKGIILAIDDNLRSLDGRLQKRAEVI